MMAESASQPGVDGWVGDRPRSWRGFLPSRTPRWLRSCAPALALLLAACALGQYETLIQTPLVQGPGQYPDTATYLLVAHRILTGGTLFDVVRTPMYPMFLAFVFAFAGVDNFAAVVGAQAFLMVVAVLEIYALVQMLSGRRMVAAIVAGAIAINPAILQWERLILTEVIAYFWIVTCLWAVTLYLRSRAWPAIVAIDISAAAALLTRPSLAFLPAVVFGALLLRAWYQRAGRLIWRQALVGLALAYGVMGLHMLGNGLTWGYYGLSSIGSYNLFAKAFEYHLETEPGSDPAVAGMRDDVRRFVASGGTSANAFYAQYHFYGQREGEPTVARYARDVVLANPAAYARGSVNDAGLTLTIPVHYYARTAPGNLLQRLIALAQIELGAYSLWPFLLLIPALAIWRRRRSRTGVEEVEEVEEDDASFVLLLFTALALVNVALVGVGAANEFYRLRSIFDWAVIAASWTIGCELALAVGGAGSRLLGVPALSARDRRPALSVSPAAASPGDLNARSALHATNTIQDADGGDDLAGLDERVDSADAAAWCASAPD
jgi:hypothetical protein